jgi:integrase/recombinase XerD
VFSILEKGQDPERHTALVKQFTKMVNKYMGRIAEKIDIRRPTTYHARHSFASQLLINGTSSDMIRPLLGHSNVSTTQNYLRGFPDSVVARSLENLIPE